VTEAAKVANEKDHPAHLQGAYIRAQASQAGKDYPRSEGLLQVCAERRSRSRAVEAAQDAPKG